MSRTSIILVALFAICQSALAADVFTVTATVGDQTGGVSIDTAQETFDSLRQQSLSAIVPSYTGVEVANMTVNFHCA